MHKQTVIDFKELKERYIFTNPIVELKAEKLDDVGRVLKEVETYQEQGYYVVGYLSYEAAAFFDQNMSVHSKSLAGEYYAYFTVHDEVEKTAIPISYEEVAMPNSWQELTSLEDYRRSIETIHHHIRQGNTYQVNYTIQLKQDLLADSFAIYNRMVVEQEAGFNAYVAHDDVAMVSMSPELFFKKIGQDLITRPMKGTLKRGKNLLQDEENRDWLQADPKNRAENMMIVDLLRNDMGKVCQIGTVKVASLCAVEQYSTVWQMTSTIVGRLRRDIGLVQLFEALFPCGSITGAPKLSTMAIIKAIEPNPRGVYCGTMGILLPNGDSIWNVPIRTIQMTGKTAYYGVGGGITWDSQWESEYEEVRQKSSVLYRMQPRFSLLTTGRISKKELIFKEQHLKRLEESSRYFSYPFDVSLFEEKLAELLTTCEEKDYRLRISLDKTGQIDLEISDLLALSADFLQAEIVERKNHRDSPFTYFKTSHRPHISTATCEQIFVDEEDRLLETSIGNLVLEIEGQPFTPPVNLGILAGIYRQHLLDEKKVVEKVLHLSDLEKADRVFVCNAVRGIYEIQIKT